MVLSSLNLYTLQFQPTNFPWKKLFTFFLEITCSEKVSYISGNETF